MAKEKIFDTLPANKIEAKIERQVQSNGSWFTVDIRPTNEKRFRRILKEDEIYCLIDPIKDLAGIDPETLLQEEFGPSIVITIDREINTLIDAERVFSYWIRKALSRPQIKDIYKPCSVFLNSSMPHLSKYSDACWTVQYRGDKDITWRHFRMTMEVAPVSALRIYPRYKKPEDKVTISATPRGYKLGVTIPKPSKLAVTLTHIFPYVEHERSKLFSGVSYNFTMEEIDFYLLIWVVNPGIIKVSLHGWVDDGGIYHSCSTNPPLDLFEINNLRSSSRHFNNVLKRPPFRRAAFPSPSINTNKPQGNLSMKIDQKVFDSNLVMHVISDLKVLENREITERVRYAPVIDGTDESFCLLIDYFLKQDTGCLPFAEGEPATVVVPFVDLINKSYFNHFIKSLQQLEQTECRFNTKIRTVSVNPSPMLYDGGPLAAYRSILCYAASLYFSDDTLTKEQVVIPVFGISDKYGKQFGDDLRQLSNAILQANLVREFPNQSIAQYRANYPEVFELVDEYQRSLVGIHYGLIKEPFEE